MRRPIQRSSELPTRDWARSTAWSARRMAPPTASAPGTGLRSGRPARGSAGRTGSSRWVVAVSEGNTALADFQRKRFPEPLKTATAAWQATQPLTNPAAPATPFDMPEYVLAENAEEQRLEATAAAESEAGGRAGEISDRYLLFTIIFASVLFFGGISGKFRWQVLDVAVLVLGALTFFAGLAIVYSSPIR